MKKIKFLFVLCLFSMISIGASAEETCPADEIWYTSTDGNIVTPYSSSAFGANIVSNTYSDGKGVIKFDGNVTSIGERAFEGCSSLASVGDLPECLSIGNYAFSLCTAITSIGNLPKCTTIGEYAFSNMYVNYFCTNLVSIGDLSACTSIGKYAFRGCSSLASVGDLPECLSIGNYAFSGCTALTSIGNLPKCTTIGEYAFSNSNGTNYCTKLVSFGYLSACTSIGDYAFGGCRTLKILTINTITPPVLSSTSAFNNCPVTFLIPSEAVETYKTADVWSNFSSRIFAIGTKTDWDVDVFVLEPGSGVETAIGTSNLNNVISLKINGKINAYDIFTMRNNMPNLHILDLTDANIVKTENGYKYYGDYTTSDSVIGNYAFYQQGKLVKVKTPKILKSIGTSAFENCTNIDELVIPSCETIGDNSFSACKNIKEVLLPEGLINLGARAFSYSYGLKTVILPTTLKTIGECAFYESNIESLTLPSNLKTIGSRAFSYCGGLSKITLPAALTSIGSEAFSYCSSLETVKTTAIDPNMITISDGSFANTTYANATLYIPYDEETGWDATYQAYRWHTQWGQFTNKATWKPNYDYVQIGGDYEQSSGTIPGENIDADLDKEGGYVVGEDAEQDLDDVHVKKDGDGTGGSVIAEGDGKQLNVKKLYTEIAVTNNKWYFFCFPFDVLLADVQAPGQYVFRTYDGKERANHGLGGWKKLDNGTTTLQAGKGYIFQTNKSGTLTIAVNNPSFNDQNKSPELETYTSSNEQDASWNFIGNPYLSYYELENLGHGAPITYWDGNQYVAVRPGDDDYSLQPFQAFFVQKTNDKSKVDFDENERETYNQSKKKNAKAKAIRAKAEIDNSRLLLNIELTDGTNTDKTRVVFNDLQKMEYEVACDASKFMSTDMPQIYSIYNNVNYAINERPNGSGEVVIGFNAPKSGTYSIGMARMDTPMLLKDAETGLTFDFANGAYTFEAKEGTYNSRFTIIKNMDPTAIHPATVGDAESYSYYNVRGQKTTSATTGIKIVKGNGTTKKVLVK